MAKNNNLQDFLADIADAIRDAEGSSDPIAAQDFADRIRAIDGIEEDLGTKLAIENFTVESGESQVPPPYDSEGYNYNAQAPVKQDSTTRSLGDLTSYTQLAVVWDNVGSGNAYGEIYGRITIDSTDTNLFQASNMGCSIYNGNIVTKINISSITGQQTATFKAYARSDSNYRGYTSESVLHIKGIYVKAV